MKTIIIDIKKWRLLVSSIVFELFDGIKQLFLRIYDDCHVLVMVLNKFISLDKVFAKKLVVRMNICHQYLRNTSAIN